MDDEFTFIDAHVHFWNHSIPGLQWRYLEPGFDHPRLRGMHRLDAPQFTDVELAEQAGPYVPSRLVHIQSCEEAEPGLETAWIQSLADSSSAVHAIIARARLDSPDIAAVLQANSAHSLYRGVRDMASIATIGTDEFTAGFGIAAETGSIVEVLVPHPKYADVCALADQYPNTKIVLGHAGLAEYRDREYFREWADRLRMFSDRQNVHVKLSALASGADPDWTPQSIGPWIRHCIDVFGPSRTMFGTNWPIDRLFDEYEHLIDAYREITTDLSTSDQNEVFAGTARRLYNLDND